MHLIAIMPVRNEDWVLGLSARAALLWCDELVILDHASVDQTCSIVCAVEREFGERVSIILEGAPEWEEMRHRQTLLDTARKRGATHVCIVDADEVLTGNLLPTIRGYIENLSPGYILRLPGYNLRGSIHRFHANGIWGDRLFSLAFKDDARANWKGDQFHHREPFGVQNFPYQPLVQGQGGILHLWGASERRLIAKHALYKMTERLRWPSKPVADIDRDYNRAIYPDADRRFEQTWAFAQVPEAWWKPYAGLMQYLHVDAEPWQEAEVRRLWEEHGAERFKDLDLFGVTESVGAAPVCRAL